MKRIAVIPGDGIGPEVIREALKVLGVLQSKHRLPLELEHLDYGAERYLKDGVTLPEGELERFEQEIDAIFLGALGDPRIPDMRHGRDILLGARFGLDLYINFRPVRCLDERFNPLKKTNAEDIDFVVFRENTEGVYVGTGGNVRKGTEHEIAINEDVNTRRGVERIIRAAFEYAHTHGHDSVVMSDKSNAMPFAHGLWRRVFAEVMQEYPSIESRHLYVDVLAMELVRAPQQFQVIVTNNLFGDIVTDIGAQLQGGLGMAASGNIHPAKVSLFEPVHGSAPPLAGQNIANPLAAIMSLELMLNHLGMEHAAKSIEPAIRAAIKANTLTRELGGTASTQEVGDFIAAYIDKHS